MRVAVVGAGAIGGWLAARLAQSGVAVSLLARGATLAALREQGLGLQEAGRDWQGQLPASSDPAELGQHELVVIALKGQQLPAAAAQAAALLAPGGKVLSAMNGLPWWLFPDRALQAVDPGGRIRALLPPDRVIGAVVHASCQTLAPGLVRHVMGQGWLIGDASEPGSAFERELLALLKAAGFEAQAVPDIRSALWYKLWGNATTNPISALTGASTDRIMADPLVLQTSDAAMHELAAIAAALGHPIPHSPAERHAITRKLGVFKTSMLQDREAGRPLELDGLLGAPREIARQLGLPTPMLDALHGLARLLSEKTGG